MSLFKSVKIILLKYRLVKNIELKFRRRLFSEKNSRVYKLLAQSVQLPKILDDPPIGF